MEKINDLNLQFYNNLEIAPFKLLAQVGGFNTYIDLDIVFPYIKNATSILEIGAGYGRCVEFLLEKKYAGKIIAVEQSPNLAEYLRKNFNGSVEIIEEKIQNLILPHQVEVALWMWSGLIDFSLEEQKQCTKDISLMLAAGGRLVIDVPKAGYKTIGQHQDMKNIVLETSYGTLKCYIPDEQDVSKYASDAAMHIIHTEHYATSTDKLRTIFILEKL